MQFAGQPPSLWPVPLPGSAGSCRGETLAVGGGQSDPLSTRSVRCECVCERERVDLGVPRYINIVYLHKLVYIHVQLHMCVLTNKDCL